jgi:hypothetical protein
MSEYGVVFRILEVSPDGFTIPVGKVYRTAPVAKQQASRRRNSWRGAHLGCTYKVQALEGDWEEI